MAISREQGRAEHLASAGHGQFGQTVYGVICATCHDYILIDKTNSRLPAANTKPAAGLMPRDANVFSHFIARGHDVVFPQDTAMQISLGTHEAPPGNPPASSNPTGN